MSDWEGLDTSTLLERAASVALSDPLREDDDRWSVVVELHRRGGADVYGAAITWCRSDSPLLRSLGADVLGQLGFGDGYPFGVASAERLTQLLSDPEPEVIDSALVALGHLGLGDLTIICALASHASADVRHGVAFCLGRRDDEIAQRTLIRLTADSDSAVRDWATFALGTLSEADTPALRDALVERLTDPEADVRGEAMRGLAVRRDQRAVPAILDELQRADGAELAIDAAIEMPDFLPVLEALHASAPDAERVGVALQECRRIGRAVE